MTRQLTPSVPRPRKAARGGPTSASGVPEASTRTRPESPRQRFARGQALREKVPLAAHAEVRADASRPDPVSLLEEQATARLPDLVPIRYGQIGRAHV